MSKKPDQLARIYAATDEFFKIAFKHLEADCKYTDSDGVVHIDAREQDMEIVLNALGNVIAGLMCALPDPPDKMEWFCMNLIRSCKEVLGRRDEHEHKHKHKITLQ